MHKDDYFIGHYREQIIQLIKECEPNREFSTALFNEGLIKLWGVAKIDGVSESDFFNLVYDHCPVSITLIEFPFQGHSSAA